MIYSLCRQINIAAFILYFYLPYHVHADLFTLCERFVSLLAADDNLLSSILR